MGEEPVPKADELPPNTTDTQITKPATAPQSQEDLIAKIVGRNMNFVSTAPEEPKEMDFIPIKVCYLIYYVVSRNKLNLISLDLKLHLL